MRNRHQWIKAMFCGIGILCSAYAGAEQAQPTGDAPGSDFLGTAINSITNPAARAAAIEIQQKLAKVQDYQVDAPGSDFLGAGIDSITNPAARAAAIEIQKKLAKVQDYQCVADSATTETVLQNLVVDVRHGQDMFKRPNCVRYEMANPRSSHAFMSLCDGKIHWIRNFDSTTQKTTAETKKMDYERLKSISLEPPSPRLMSPFLGMRGEKINLVREDQDVWVFSDGQTEKTVGENGRIAARILQKRKRASGNMRNLFRSKSERGTHVGNICFHAIAGRSYQGRYREYHQADQ